MEPLAVGSLSHTTSESRRHLSFAGAVPPAPLRCVESTAWVPGHGHSAGDMQVESTRRAHSPHPPSPRPRVGLPTGLTPASFSSGGTESVVSLLTWQVCLPGLVKAEAPGHLTARQRDWFAIWGYGPRQSQEQLSLRTDPRQPTASAVCMFGYVENRPLET